MKDFPPLDPAPAYPASNDAIRKWLIRLARRCGKTRLTSEMIRVKMEEWGVVISDDDWEAIWKEV